MATTHPTAVRNSIADHVVDKYDAGSGPGKVQFTKTAGDYTGSNLLAEVTLGDPAFGSASSAKASANGLPKTDTSANNTGTAVEFRGVDSDDNPVHIGTVTAVGGGGDMEMPSTSIVATEPVDLTQLDYTAPL